MNRAKAKPNRAGKRNTRLEAKRNTELQRRRNAKRNTPELVDARNTSAGGRVVRGPQLSLPVGKSSRNARERARGNAVVVSVRFPDTTLRGLDALIAKRKADKGHRDRWYHPTVTRSMLVHEAVIALLKVEGVS